MAHRRKHFKRLAANPLRRRIGTGQLGMFGFDRLQLAE
jgi:hypothetical protein